MTGEDVTISNPETLCRFLLECLGNVPGLNQDMERMDVLGSLEPEALDTFFESGTALGLYVRRGEFETDSRIQMETMTVTVVIGCKSLVSGVDALGTGDDSGAWQYLEMIRRTLSWPEIIDSNIQNCMPLRWAPLHSNSKLAVLGFDFEIQITRPLQEEVQVSLNTFGAGYGGANEAV